MKKGQKRKTKMSQEEKDRRSKCAKEKGFGKWMKGRKPSKETRQKNSISNKGHKVSIETRKKLSKALSGKNNPRYGKKLSKEIREKIKRGNKGKHFGENCNFWKGGVTKLIFRIRTCFLYRLWRSDVFVKYHFTCQKCNQKGGELNAHHINSLSSIILINNIKTLKQVLVHEELWNINNGIVFCKKCHIDFHKRFGYKNNKEQILEFIN